MSLIEVDSQLWEEFAAVAQSSGCELLDCEFKGGTLRLVIDRPEGVTLDDCQSVSKQISAILDVADFGTGRYLLEVSSPGLDRRFYSEADYERFQGRQIRVTWKDPTQSIKQTVVGTLEDYSRERREIVVSTPQEEKIHRIALGQIQLARLEPEF